MESSMASTDIRLRPLADRVIIRVEDAAAVSKGGILIPDSARGRPQRGTVVAVGPGKSGPTDWQDVAVQKGDVVLFQRYAGVTVPDHDDYIILREDDVLAVAVDQEEEE